MVQWSDVSGSITLSLNSRHSPLIPSPPSAYLLPALLRCNLTNTHMEHPRMQWIADTTLNSPPTETPRLRLHIHLLPTKEAPNSRHLAEHMKLVCAGFFHPYPFVWQPNTMTSRGLLPTKSTQIALASKASRAAQAIK
jgi:hypothetical protein